MKKGDIVLQGHKGEIALIDKVADHGVYWCYFNSNPLSIKYNHYGVLYEDFDDLEFVCEL